MRIALLADVHANLPALEAVIADAGSVDLWLLAGDILGYYADVNETCALLRKIDARAIRGNHDAYVLGLLEPKQALRSAYRTDWTRRRLNDENRKWLESLPPEIRLREGGIEIIARHACPWDEETYLYPNTPRLSEIWLDEGELLLLGHTHHPMRIPRGEGQVVNPGSVGQPRDRNPHASYAILNTLDFSTSFNRVAYPVGTLQRRLRMLGFDESMVEILHRV